MTGERGRKRKEGEREEGERQEGEREEGERVKCWWGGEGRSVRWTEGRGVKEGRV